MARASGSYPEGRWFDSTRRYHFSLRRYGSLAQLGEHLPYKQRVTGSSPVTPTTDCLRLLWSLKQYKSQVTDDLFCGLVVQLVRMPACHAGGRRFEPVPGRQLLIKNVCSQISAPQRLRATQSEVKKASMCMRRIFHLWQGAEGARSGMYDGT